MKEAVIISASFHKRVIYYVSISLAFSFISPITFLPGGLYLLENP